VGLAGCYNTPCCSDSVQGEADMGVVLVAVTNCTNNTYELSLILHNVPSIIL
jgi:hypothetical protein